MSDFIEELYFGVCNKRAARSVDMLEYNENEMSCCIEQGKAKLMGSLKGEDRHEFVGLVACLEQVKERECLDKFRQGFSIGMRMAFDALRSEERGEREKI